MGVKQKYTSGRLVFYNGEDTAVGQLLQLGRTATAALILGGGTSASPLTNSSADKNFMGFYLKSSAASGTSRGTYQKLVLSGGAGGEAIRAFTVVESNTPADTCNGIHSSLGFGSSAGNITGLGTALRATLHVPAGRSLTGTVAALQAEIYGDGASASISSATKVSFLRVVNDGHADSKADVDDHANLLELVGFGDDTAQMVDSISGEPTWTSGCFLLKCDVGGTACYLVASKSNS